MSSMQHQHREGGLVGDQRSLRTLIASTILLICEREYMKAGEKLNKGRVTSEHQKLTLLNEMHRCHAAAIITRCTQRGYLGGAAGTARSRVLPGPPPGASPA